MTPRERECLRAIEELTVDDVAPTMQELAERLRLKSKSGVHRLIESLEAQGRVTRGSWGFGRHASRGLRVVGHFDAAAIDRMSHADLLALRAQIDRRLGA